MAFEQSIMPSPLQTIVVTPRCYSPSSSSPSPSPSSSSSGDESSDHCIKLNKSVNTSGKLKNDNYSASTSLKYDDKHHRMLLESMENCAPPMELPRKIDVNHHAPQVEIMQNHLPHAESKKIDVNNQDPRDVETIQNHQRQAETIQIGAEDRLPHVESMQKDIKHHSAHVESLQKDANHLKSPEISLIMQQDDGFPYSGPLARRCVSHNWDRSHREKNAMFRTRSAKWRHSSSNGLKKEDYLMFRTRASLNQSKRLHSRLPYEDNMSSVPAGRYFDALEGPDFEVLKDPQEPLLLPDEKWPFLLRFPIVCYGVCLGLGSQTMLWKSLATSSSMRFLKVPLIVNLLLWCLTAASVVIISIVYLMKCILYFEAVRREYYHPVRVNFVFSPWIACMFLLLGIPPRIASTIHPAIWCVLVAPLLVLSLKIHGQWPSGGERRLSNVANPSIHLSLAGYFVSALLAAVVGWKEPGFFLWAVGCAHYMVVFVTLYQRLPTAELLPKELHPIFFLFVAAPSAASISWKAISGSFDRVSRVPYFIALFLYASLVSRFNFFCGFRFSIAWWAYTFPMASSAIATIEYSMEVHHVIPQILAVILSLISVVMTFILFVFTILHASMGTLFPNDLAIAIRRRRHKRRHVKRQGQESIR